MRRLSDELNAQGQFFRRFCHDSQRGQHAGNNSLQGASFSRTPRTSMRKRGSV